MVQMRDLFMFVHIPKTAGTTITDHVWEFVQPARHRVLPAHMADLERPACVLDKSAEELERVDVVIGHGVHRALFEHFSDRRIRLFTALREPTSLMVSQYNWDNQKNGDNARDYYGDFEQWVRGEARNRMCKWLLTRYARGSREDQYLDDMSQGELFEQPAELLDDFFCVASASLLAMTLRPVFEALQIPTSFDGFGKVSGRDFKRTIRPIDRVQKVVAEECEADMRLWQQYAGLVPDVNPA